jgi:pilus assembly protein CpaB
MQAISTRRLLLLTAAIALSLATAMMVRGWVDEARRSGKATPVEAAKPAVTKVVVAAHDLPAGQFLKPDDLQWQPWPDEALSRSYMLEGTRTIEELVGSVVRAGIGTGEPVTDDRMIKKGDRGFLSAVMAPATRAVTVQLQQNAGLGGLVLPGDHVDVILTATLPGSGTNDPEHHASETVLEDIRVIAIDQKMNDMTNESVMAHTATLEVTPKQAEVLALVSDMGKLSLTLRSLASGDEKPMTTDAKGQPIKPSVTWDNEATNLGLSPRMVAPKVTSDGKVDLVRGGKTTALEFPKSAP